MTKRVLVVVLPALLAISCGDDGDGSKLDANIPDAATKMDTGVPDATGTPDAPMQPDLTPAQVDGPPASIDGQQSGIDMMPEIDGAPMEMDGAQEIDGAAIDGADEADVPMPIDGGAPAVDGGMIDA